VKERTEKQIDRNISKFIREDTRDIINCGLCTKYLEGVMGCNEKSEMYIKRCFLRILADLLFCKGLLFQSSPSDSIPWTNSMATKKSLSVKHKGKIVECNIPH
jgi:hypothetical protein